MGREAYGAIVEPRSKVQAPDLVVYKRDGAEWFFVEVKGPRDRLREGQLRFSEMITELTGHSVFELKLREIRGHSG